MNTHVVILGAGCGGLELSSRLSAELAGQVDVTVIDQSDSFLFGFSKLDVMFGRRTMGGVRILLAAGTGPQPVDRWGGTPLSDAEGNGHTHVAELTRQAAHPITQPIAGPDERKVAS